MDPPSAPSSLHLPLSQSVTPTHSSCADQLTLAFAPIPSPPSTPIPTTWTPTQEARLLYVRFQLKEAQKRWSAGQDLWLKEVEHLTHLKKAHSKAQRKKTKERSAKPGGMWRTGSWKPVSLKGGRWSSAGTAISDAADDGDGDDEGGGPGNGDGAAEEDEAVSPTAGDVDGSGEDELADKNRTSSRSSLTTKLRRLSMPPLGKRRNTLPTNPQLTDRPLTPARTPPASPLLERASSFVVGSQPTLGRGNGSPSSSSTPPATPGRGALLRGVMWGGGKGG